MQRYKMARWKLILRRGTFRKRLIRPVRRLRHSRSQAARICSTVILTIAWLVLPLLPGCDRRSNSPRPAPVTPIPAPTSSPSPSLPPSTAPATGGSGRDIKVRGLDNEYLGTTRVLPNKQLIHRKDSHD